MHGTPVGKPIRQHPPLATAFKQIKNGTKDLVQINGTGLGAFAHRFEQGQERLELLPADVAWVRLAGEHSPDLPQ